jgi:hypothetical protein
VPVLSVPIVDLTQLNYFKPFGLVEGAGHVNPTYELHTIGDTTSVRAVGPGTVINILANPTPDTDSEIHVRPSDAPDYLVVYDHVASLQVVVGQSVTAGQVIGRIGPWVPGVGRIELQVNRGSGSSGGRAVPEGVRHGRFQRRPRCGARTVSNAWSQCVLGELRPAIGNAPG